MIRMQQSFRKMNVLYAKAESFEEMKKLPSKKIFDEDICGFLDSLAAAIRKDAQAKQYPDIQTFGFFCRKANIDGLKVLYEEPLRIGRGFSFHIAPSNVPINFAYTLAAGLLAGNACVVRTSSKEFVQTSIVCRLINQVMNENKSEISRYIAIIQYGHDKKINDYLSALSDVRIIWGGDNTIREIRKSEIPVRCTEIAFADRYSICVLYADEICDIKNWPVVAQNFYNDTYLYDQNACSSPRLLYWIGDEEHVKKARQIFWSEIHQSISPRYRVEPVIAVDKLMTDCRAAIELEGVNLECDEDNLFHRITLSSLDKDITQYQCPGGSFVEYRSKDLNDLKQIVSSKYQTLSYLGGNGKEIARWIAEQGLSGIDRVVPMGKTSEFRLIWDGYHLIDMMSRKIDF